MSNFDVAQLRRARAVAPLASRQPPYSALMHEVEQEILPWCAQADIGVIACSTLQSGLLSGRMTRERIEVLPDDDWRKHRSPDFREPRLSQHLTLVETFREIGEQHEVGAAAVAIAWILRHPAVTGAIVGAPHPDQVDALLAAAVRILEPDELERIEARLPAGMSSNLPGDPDWRRPIAYLAATASRL